VYTEAVVARPTYRRLSHTADLRLVVWGCGFEELCGGAVRGAMHEALGRPPRGTPGRYVEVEHAPDDEVLRLVRTVNEALFLIYARRLVSVGVRWEDRRVLLGVRPLPNGKDPEVEVKAATLHALAHPAKGGRQRLVLTLDL